MRRFPWFAHVFVFGLLLAISSQGLPAAGPPKKGKILLDDLLGQKKGALSATLEQVAEPKPEVHAALIPSTAKAGDVVTLVVTVSLPPGTHTYSTNPTVLGATKIEVTDAAGLKPLGEFEADRAPKTHTDPTTQKPLEEFEGHVVWLRPYRVTADQPNEVRAAGVIDLNYCSDSNCRRLNQPIAAGLVSSGTSNVAKGESSPSEDLFRKAIAPTFAGQAGPVQLAFELSPSTPKPGDVVTLSITVRLEEGYHTYATTQPEALGSTPTTITLTAGRALTPIGESFRPDRAPETSTGADGETREEYHGKVTWTRRFKFEPQGNAQSPAIEGKIKFGVCDANKCLPPKTESFALGEVTGVGPLSAPLPDDHTDEMLVRLEGEKEASLWFYLVTAFLGGMILNVMPCVLPVLAIKVLSFVQQAGESRSRIFLLNIAYTGGVLLVFLILAGLAVTLKLSWGGLFQHIWFNMVMACLVFAMGLSLLGVFEIPVPGLVGSAASRHQREGLLGAFLTGIFATLLATPCTGPLMAPALGWAVQQRPPITLLIAGVMGLGMAFPYLVLGAFPRLVRWLPKPGTWMVRFKELAGFVLMGSVIFIIYYINKKYTITMLVMLLGVAIGLWMIGTLYDINTHVKRKNTVRLSALAITLVICWFGYWLSVDNPYRLPWQPFSEERITTLLKEKKTVLVDFTADWCLNCHVNEQVALNTKATQRLVEEHQVVALLADFTDQSETIHNWLQKFQQNGVPLTVIFPANRPNRPIVLTGVYSQSTLLEKLNEALEVPNTGTASNAQAVEALTTVR